MTLIGCVFCVISLTSVENFCLLVFYLFLNVFIFIAFDKFFPAFVSKIQKHIKSRKSKKFDRHCYVLSQACFALYLRTNDIVHL